MTEIVLRALSRSPQRLLARPATAFALALPLVFCAVWLGVLVARRLLDRLERRGSPVADGLATCVTAACVAVATADVMGLSTPLHSALFAASHGGPELSPVL